MELALSTFNGWITGGTQAGRSLTPEAARFRMRDEPSKLAFKGTGSSFGSRSTCMGRSPTSTAVDADVDEVDLLAVRCGGDIVASACAVLGSNCEGFPACVAPPEASAAFESLEFRLCK